MDPKVRAPDAVGSPGDGGPVPPVLALLMWLEAGRVVLGRDYYQQQLRVAAGGLVEKEPKPQRLLTEFGGSTRNFGMDLSQRDSHWHAKQPLEAQVVAPPDRWLAQPEPRLLEPM